jgi:hypothetical protein
MAKKKRASAEQEQPSENLANKKKTSKADKNKSLVWSAASVAAAFAGVAIAKFLLNLIWRTATGKKPPTNPTNPEVDPGEAITWAVASGAAIALARILATRRAAQYYARSTGHLPPGLEQKS